MPSGDVYSASSRFSIKGEKTVNVLHFSQTSADGSGPVNQELADAILQDIWPSYKALLSNDCTLQNISVYKIAPAVGGSILVNVAEAGGVAVDTIPPNACVVATLYTDHFTGRGRGRIFMSGIPDSHVDGGRIVNASAALYVTFLNTLKAPIAFGSGVSFVPSVWSTKGAIARPITAHALRAALHNLRSRRMANP